jgi:hypothetical protein
MCLSTGNEGLLKQRDYKSEVKGRWSLKEVLCLQKTSDLKRS